MTGYPRLRNVLRDEAAHIDRLRAGNCHDDTERIVGEPCDSVECA